MYNFINETGNRYGRLVVIKQAGRNKKGKGAVLWECLCDCGNIRTVIGYDLRRGHTTSCGCYQREKATKHGYCEKKIYGVWKAMKYRCLNKNGSAYKHYGGRGIKVCKEWLEFLPFYEWAMSHGYKEKLTIERIENNGNYEPDNCTFATWQEQSRNKRMRKDNKTGTQGICWAEKRKKYRAYINGNSIGYFNNVSDAVAARKVAECG